MVVTRDTSASSGSQPSNTLTQASTSSPATPYSSLFGTGIAGTGNDAPVNLKRKITDPNLEVIKIDAMHDLTLIVGTPAHPKGQKAFQVNKGSFRNVSVVWTKMLSGRWVESKQSEIRFPDDSCEAFLIVLRIAHLQVSHLPKVLSRDGLYDLATLADKYELQNAVRLGAELKNWLLPHRGNGSTWLATTDLQQFTFIAQAFDLEDDLNYLVSRLAMDVRVTKTSYYYTSGAAKSVKIRSDFPNGILVRVIRVRNNVLHGLLLACKVSLTQTIEKETGSLCKDAMCPIRQAGIMLKGFHRANLHPLPDKPSAMYSSVKSYLTGLKNVGAGFEQLMPSKCKSNDRHYEPSLSLWLDSKDTCYGDFGIATQVREIVKQNVHADIVKELQKDKLI